MSGASSSSGRMESSMSRLQLSGPKEAPEDDEVVTSEEVVCGCEYRDDMWHNLLQQEAEKPQIHLTSPQLEYRGALVARLRVIRRRLRLGAATLHAAVQLLDLFMDRHELRPDRLMHAAIACLSLAAKSEERHGVSPRLSALSAAGEVAVCARTLRRLEWLVAAHVGWRLLLPTAHTAAALLRHLLVAAHDLSPSDASRGAALARRAHAHLDAHLDLTLSDVRLKVMGSVEVGAACVLCARAAVQLEPWPPRLARAAARSAHTLAPIARLLQGMMRVVKSRAATTLGEETDAGYSSTTPADSPDTTPVASPPSRRRFETLVVRRDQLAAHLKRGVKRGACARGYHLESKRFRAEPEQRLL